MRITFPRTGGADEEGRGVPWRGAPALRAAGAGGAQDQELAEILAAHPDDPQEAAVAIVGARKDTADEYRGDATVVVLASM